MRIATAVLVVLLAYLLSGCPSSGGGSSAPVSPSDAQQPDDSPPPGSGGDAVPAVSITQAVSRRQQLVLRGTVEYDGEIEQVFVEIDGIPQSVSGRNHWAVTTPPLNLGQRRVTVLALDRDGLQSQVLDMMVLVNEEEEVSACESYGEPVQVATLPSEVDESSGLSVSLFDEGILWSHNDSGDLERIFAIRSDGELLAEVTLRIETPQRSSALLHDFEDMSHGPCFAGDLARSCLYIGDIGDNVSVTSSLRIHRLPEPDPLLGDQEVEVETMVAVYPDGAKDAETLIVDDDGHVFIVSKEIGRFRIYGAPFQVASEEEPVVLTHYSTGTPLDEEGLPTLIELGGGSTSDGGPSTSLGAQFLTGGDWDFRRNRVLLVSYWGAYEFRPADGQFLGDIGGQPFTKVPNISGETEGAAYGKEGYWLSEEDNTGSGAPPLIFVPCEGP